MDPQDRFGPFVHWEEYTDNELMARASAGDSKAYETLVLRYRSVQEDFLDAVALKESSPEEEYLKKGVQGSCEGMAERTARSSKRGAVPVLCGRNVLWGNCPAHGKNRSPDQDLDLQVYGMCLRGSGPALYFTV